MVSEWTSHELSEFVSIKHGFAFKGQYFKDYATSDYLMTPGNFAVGGGFKGDKFKYYDGPVPEDYILHENDLVVTMTGLSKEADTLGYSAFVPTISGCRLLHNQRVGLVEFKNAELDKTYLYFLLRSREYRHHVVSGATGTTVKHTSPTKIASFQFRKPPLHTQKIIGERLIAIENKIQLNRQTNQTLESMAQALFKSWFVDFDPVIDNALAAGNAIPEPLQARAEQRKALQCSSDALDGQAVPQLPEAIRQLFPNSFVLDAEMGWIPEGWRVGKTSEIASTNPTLWTKKNAPSHVNYIDLSNAKYGCIEVVTPYRYEEAPSRAKRILAPHDTIIGMVRPGNRSFAYIYENGLTGSTGFAVMRPKQVNLQAYLYFHLTRDDVIDELARIADGGAYPAIRPEDVSEFPCMIANDDIYDKFESFVGPHLQRIGENLKQSGTFADLRDTLLPKLISGELRIPEAANIAKQEQYTEAADAS